MALHGHHYNGGDGVKQHILPNNATALEIAVDLAGADALDFDSKIRDMWSADRCPIEFLELLAWAYSVDEWDSEWPENIQRAVVGAAIEVHRHKGTIWAVRKALQSAGYGDAKVIEQWTAETFDGAFTFDGSKIFANSDHWAEYRIEMVRPISVAQAGMVRKVLATVAPARCHLKVLDFSTATNVYNGAIRFDGAYTHGVA